MPDQAAPHQTAGDALPCPSIGFSVIVPVYNEAKILGRFLAVIRDGLPDNVEILISLNGCTDESASIIAGVSDARISIVESHQRNKAAAIRAAEAKASRYPRFYVDADVEFRGSDLSRLASTLAETGAMMVSPQLSFQYDGATRLARAFNDVWTASGHIRDGAFQYVIGVSERGRMCWGDMPDVLADDTFMRLSVPPEKRVIDRQATAIVRLPTRFRSIIRVRRRIALGLRQLRLRGFVLKEAATRPTGVRGARPLKSQYLIYLLGVLAGRVWAYASPLDQLGWVKDHSSRENF